MSPMTPLKAQAIQTALMGDWQNAVTLNQTLLEENPDDIDTLNRLAFALGSLGNIKEARDIYQKVLTLDMQNPIALRNLKRLSGAIGGKPQNGVASIPLTNVFIEEPGKTKVIELINVADKKALVTLRAGETLMISVKRMKIFLLDSQKNYVGMLPDDISKRLIEFINGGNAYEAFVKTVDHKVVVFIRETRRSTKFKNQPSFASSEKTRLVFDGKIRPVKLEKDAATDDENSYDSDSQGTETSGRTSEDAV